MADRFRPTVPRDGRSIHLTWTDLPRLFRLNGTVSGKSNPIGPLAPKECKLFLSSASLSANLRFGSRSAQLSICDLHFGRARDFHQFGYTGHGVRTLNRFANISFPTRKFRVFGISTMYCPFVQRCAMIVSMEVALCEEYSNETILALSQTVRPSRPAFEFRSEPSSIETYARSGPPSNWQIARASIEAAQKVGLWLVYEEF
jgi:hypothetical protein